MPDGIHRSCVGRVRKLLSEALTYFRHILQRLERRSLFRLPCAELPLAVQCLLSVELPAQLPAELSWGTHFAVGHQTQPPSVLFPRIEVGEEKA